MASGAPSRGGGIWTNGTTRIGNSIVAGNIGGAGPDVSGTVISDGFNLIGRKDGSEGFGAPGDQTGTIEAPLQALLGPLQDNGGPTFTMAPLPGSPARDKGRAGTITNDQRGSRRPDDFPSLPNASGGDGSDIGAFELRKAGLLNISTRARVLAGDDALIAGFIVTAGRPKELIVRGIGPSLPLAGRLADPTIQVYDEHGAGLAVNDNWEDAGTALDIQRTLPPQDSLEAALWGLLNPSAYTLTLRGANDGTGIGVVEVYDLDPGTDSGLGNISSRGFVGEEDDVLICGIIVGPPGSMSTRVVLRALGPSLAPFGIANALSDPALDLRDASGTLLAFNQDWEEDGGASIIQALQLAPGNPTESATIQTLAPGAYTAIVRGRRGQMGVGLVEAYDVGPE